jgi:hypothetical protein
MRRGTKIYEAVYFHIELDVRTGIIRLSRTSRAYESLVDVGLSHAAVHERLWDLRGRHLVLLLDLRAAPPRNDPEFEEALVASRRELFSFFDRVAILVRTAAGMMQLTRMVRSDGGGAGVFHDEEKAIDYLLDRPEPVGGRWRRPSHQGEAPRGARGSNAPSEAPPADGAPPAAAPDAAVAGGPSSALGSGGTGDGRG